MNRKSGLCTNNETKEVEQMAVLAKPVNVVPVIKCCLEYFKGQERT